MEMLLKKLRGITGPVIIRSYRSMQSKIVVNFLCPSVPPFLRQKFLHFSYFFRKISMELTFLSRQKWDKISYYLFIWINVNFQWLDEISLVLAQFSAGTEKPAYILRSTDYKKNWEIVGTTLMKKMKAFTRIEGNK